MAVSTLYDQVTKTQAVVQAPDGTEVRSAGEFIPSNYSALKSATTTVSGQSEAIAAGATKLRVHNIGATNYALIAFGESAADAETNVATGVLVEVDETIMLGIPANATHYAWLGNTGTVSLNIVQGI